MTSWKQFRYRLEFLAVFGLARFVAVLPRKGCVVLARLLGAIAFIVDRRGRSVALANIEAAFPDRFTFEEAEAIVRASYKNFARTFLDLFWSTRLNAQNFASYLRVEGLDIVRKLQAQKRGIVFMCVHSGNFEWASLAGGFLDAPMMIVAEKLKNPALDPIFVQLRESSGNTITLQEKAMLRLFRQVKRGKIAGILIDLNLPPSQAVVVIESFGMKTCVTFLHAVLALQGGAALVPIDSESLPDGSCRIMVHPPLDVSPDATPGQVAQSCWTFFEALIRERPDQWMWSYKHWRYKPSDATRSYPFYANVSSKFDNLTRRQEKQARSV